MFAPIANLVRLTMHLIKPVLRQFPVTSLEFSPHPRGGLQVDILYGGYLLHWECLSANQKEV